MWHRLCARLGPKMKNKNYRIFFEKEYNLWVSKIPVRLILSPSFGLTLSPEKPYIYTYYKFKYKYTHNYNLLSIQGIFTWSVYHSVIPEQVFLHQSARPSARHHEILSPRNVHSDLVKSTQWRHCASRSIWHHSIFRNSNDSNLLRKHLGKVLSNCSRSSYTSGKNITH